MFVYIITNHHQHYLGKQAQWLEAGDVAHCFRTPHYDVALNQLIEVNARDIEQRLTLLECPLDDKGQPVLADAMPARKKAVQFDEPEPGTETAAAEEGEDGDHSEVHAGESDQLDESDNMVESDNRQDPANDYAG